MHTVGDLARPHVVAEFLLVESWKHRFIQIAVGSRPVAHPQFKPYRRPQRMNAWNARALRIGHGANTTANTRTAISGHFPACRRVCPAIHATIVITDNSSAGFTKHHVVGYCYATVHSTSNRINAPARICSLILACILVAVTFM